MGPISEESIEFSARDGFRLRGTLRSPIRADDVKCAVILNSGAGIAETRYERFSRYLATNGVAVLTYDYRGIGTSERGRIRKLQATIEDWSELDCSAAVGTVHEKYKPVPIIGIGHSIGGLLFGGATNADRIDHFLFLCPHTGYVGDYRARYITPMAILWHLAMPIATKAFGYFPAKFLRLGEDIPGGVAMQWARHVAPFDAASSGRRRSARLAEYLTSCARTTGTALLITFSDDGFATPRGRARVKRLFSSLRTSEWTIRPEEVGMKRIGHFGFFRKDAQAMLWPRVLSHLDQVKSIPLHRI
jgi:predicted alpha/beta hydrolase